MLITFEGIDGCGKSTQLDLLQSSLEGMGFSCKRFREPGGTELSEKIRQLLLDPDLSIDPFPELLLFSAARSQLVREKIRPCMEDGYVVLLDRFYDSTTAYQAAGRGIVSLDWAKSFHSVVTGGLVPDLTFLLDIDLDLAEERMGDRERDRMEKADRSFFEKVRRAFLDLAEEEDRIVCIDASDSVENIQKEILDLVIPAIHEAQNA